MGTFSSNILPAVTGQDLGSPSQRWDLFGQAGDFSTTLNVTGNTTIGGTLTTGTINSVVYATNGIQNAINSTAGAVTVLIPPGTYTENISITKSDVRLIGAGRDLTIIKPAVDGTPAITIDATAAGVGGLNHCEVSDLSINNNGSFTTADGIVIKGRLDIDQPNDRHKFSSLYIVGMRDDISIQGRTIWTEFLKVTCETAKRDGFRAVTTAVINYVALRDSRFAVNQSYGINWNNTNVNPSLSIVLDHVNAENNGASGVLANGAGVFLSGVAQADIFGGYFENNCTANPDGKSCDIRITGTFGHAIAIKDNLFQGSPICVYNDATLTTGLYQGNYMAPTVNTFHIATTHALSKILIGNNYDNSASTYVADGGGNTHVVFNAQTDSANNLTIAGLLTASGGVQGGGGVFTSLAAGTTKTIFDTTGFVNKYNNVVTAGNGLTSIHGATAQKAETGADASVLSFTPPAGAGTYRIQFVLSLSAANTATLGWTATWKDSNGNAQAPTNLSLFQEGAAAPALTFTTSSTGNYYGTAIVDIDSSATAVVVKLTFSGTSFAGKASATIERLQ